MEKRESASRERTFHTHMHTYVHMCNTCTYIWHAYKYAIISRRNSPTPPIFSTRSISLKAILYQFLQHLTIRDVRVVQFGFEYDRKIFMYTLYVHYMHIGALATSAKKPTR